MLIAVYRPRSLLLRSWLGVLLHGNIIQVNLDIPNFIIFLHILGRLLLVALRWFRALDLTLCGLQLLTFSGQFLLQILLLFLG